MQEVSQLRRLRIAAPVQLCLDPGMETAGTTSVWAAMPEVAQSDVLAILARLIARGVVADDDEEMSR